MRKRRPFSPQKERELLSLLLAGRRRKASYIHLFAAIVLLIIGLLWLFVAVAVFASLNLTGAFFAGSCLVVGFFCGFVAHYKRAVARWPIVAPHLNHESIKARIDQLGT